MDVSPSKKPEPYDFNTPPRPRKVTVVDNHDEIARNKAQIARNKAENVRNKAAIKRLQEKLHARAPSRQHSRQQYYADRDERLYRPY